MLRNVNFFLLYFPSLTCCCCCEYRKMCWIKDVSVGIAVVCLPHCSDQCLPFPDLVVVGWFRFVVVRSGYFLSSVLVFVTLSIRLELSSHQSTSLSRSLSLCVWLSTLPLTHTHTQRQAPGGRMTNQVEGGWLRVHPVIQRHRHKYYSYPFSRSLHFL